MNNNAGFVRIQLAKRFLQEVFAGTLKKTIDKIPVDMVPKKNSSFRCCVYKDRAILRYRLMALLGGSIEAEVDETRRLRIMSPMLIPEAARPKARCLL